MHFKTEFTYIYGESLIFAVDKLSILSLMGRGLLFTVVSFKIGLVFFCLRVKEIGKVTHKKTEQTRLPRRYVLVGNLYAIGRTSSL